MVLWQTGKIVSREKATAVNVPKGGAASTVTVGPVLFLSDFTWELIDNGQSVKVTKLVLRSSLAGTPLRSVEVWQLMANRKKRMTQFVIKKALGLKKCIKCVMLPVRFLPSITSSSVCRTYTKRFQRSKDFRHVTWKTTSSYFYL